jgi:K+-transporting ATPase A subunit
MLIIMMLERYFFHGTGHGKVQIIFILIITVSAMEQILKYTPENMKYYFTYAIEIQELPLNKLKFLDEAHFVPSHLLKSNSY